MSPRISRNRSSYKKYLTGGVVTERQTSRIRNLETTLGFKHRNLTGYDTRDASGYIDWLESFSTKTSSEYRRAVARKRRDALKRDEQRRLRWAERAAAPPDYLNHSLFDTATERQVSD